MKFLTDDVRITGMEEVIAPEQLLRDLPVPDAVSRLIFDTRKEAAAILHGEDDRLIAVIGPCSIHDPAAAPRVRPRLRRGGEHADEVRAAGDHAGATSRSRAPPWAGRA
ncbi:MAG: hypothetical protein U5R48_00650 [Gammaproteobacteria bacterium]|nr:hypothetical protein [Gammaproteobacteria bacterium]